MVRRFTATFPIVQIKKAESEALNKCSIGATVEAATVQNTWPRHRSHGRRPLRRTFLHLINILTHAAQFPPVAPPIAARFILPDGVCHLPLLVLYYVGIVLTRLLRKAPDSAHPCSQSSSSVVVHVATSLCRAQLVSVILSRLDFFSHHRACWPDPRISNLISSYDRRCPGFFPILWYLHECLLNN